MEYRGYDSAGIACLSSTKDQVFVRKEKGKVAELKKEGVTIVDKIEDSDYGKFVHIIDMEGNKIQLWEPNNNE